MKTAFECASVVAQRCHVNGARFAIGVYAPKSKDPKLCVEKR